MSTGRRGPGAGRLLAPGLPLLLCAVLAALLAAFGKTSAALGVGLGFVLFLANTYLLAATLRSLVARDASHASAVLAAASSVARLLLLGVALAALVLFVGREVFLGAGGGLALSQISLLLRRFGSKGEA